MSTVSEVRAEIQKFRLKNPNPSKPLPIEIREMVLSLSKSKKVPLLAKALDLPVTTIYGWKKKSRQKTSREVTKPLITHKASINPTNVIPLGTVSSFIQAHQQGEMYEIEMSGSNNKSIKVRFNKNDQSSFGQFIHSMISVL